MSNVKSYFTIKELENISSISAHTIRIWERRYQIFQPSRTPNNKRYYDLHDLEYLLTINLLREEGLKISKIASYSKQEVFVLAQDIVGEAFNKDHALVELKMAMYGYDEDLFEQLYEKSIKEKDFRSVFKELFLPFLQYVGQFWHTKTVTIAHEHFITNLIYQKIQLNTVQLPRVPKSPTNRTFVLYLPEEEMHEIGLLYLNYELKLKGYQTIYLGRSVPFEDLETLKSLYSNICLVSNLAITLTPHKQREFFGNLKSFLTNTNHHAWAIGHLSIPKELHLPQQLSVYQSIGEVLNSLNSEES